MVRWMTAAAAAADMSVVASAWCPLSLTVVAVRPGLQVHCTALFRRVGESSGFVDSHHGKAESCCVQGEQSRSEELV